MRACVRASLSTSGLSGPVVVPGLAEVGRGYFRSGLDKCRTPWPYRTIMTSHVIAELRYNMLYPPPPPPFFFLN